MLYQDKKCHSR